MSRALRAIVAKTASQAECSPTVDKYPDGSRRLRCALPWQVVCAFAVSASAFRSRNISNMWRSIPAAVSLTSIERAGRMLVRAIIGCIRACAAWYDAAYSSRSPELAVVLFCGSQRRHE